jgi:hypothetical protein
MENLIIKHTHFLLDDHDEIVDSIHHIQNSPKSTARIWLLESGTTSRASATTYSNQTGLLSIVPRKRAIQYRDWKETV